jgi:hypothetical protein
MVHTFGLIVHVLRVRTCILLGSTSPIFVGVLKVVVLWRVDVLCMSTSACMSMGMNMDMG